MPDSIRHPCGFGGKEWIPVSGTGMTGRNGTAVTGRNGAGMTGGESHAGRDPASMRFYRKRVDSRVRPVK